MHVPRGVDRAGAGGRRPLLAKLRVLVVDDNPDCADSLANVLKLQGHSVVCAYDGKAALDHAARYQPDVVLLDLELPVMNGLEIAEAIQHTPGIEAVRIFAVTGQGDAHARNCTQAAGFSGHLVKPVEPSELEAAINGF